MYIFFIFRDFSVKEQEVRIENCIVWNEDPAFDSAETMPLFKRLVSPLISIYTYVKLLRRTPKKLAFLEATLRKKFALFLREASILEVL